ncbi:MAG: ribose 5-phosphate isomerase B [Pelovirga sp.]
MIVVASDHGGLTLKNAVLEALRRQQIECADYGTDGTASVDYPDYAAKVARAVADGTASAGVLVCGTGIGMSITANKIPGVRAALVHDEFTARMAGEHNNANVLVMGGRILTPEQGVQLVNVWLQARYEGGRHQNRLDKITALER